MFRSLLTIIRELYLYLTKVMFMLKHSVKLCRYIQGPPKKCIHTLTKENSMLYNRLL